MSQQCPARDTPEKEPKHFWQSPGSSVQSRTHCPSSSLCPQLLQKAAEVALALLLQSQLLSPGVAERDGGSTRCALQFQPLPNRRWCVE